MTTVFNFGKRREVKIGIPLDTWLYTRDLVNNGRKVKVPIYDIQGFSSRVFDCQMEPVNGDRGQYVIKIGRWDRGSDKPTTDSLFRMFRDEIIALDRLQQESYGWLTPMREVGFLKFHRVPGNSDELAESNNGSKPWECQADDLKGEGIRYSLAEKEQYLEDFCQRNREGWHPYILLQKRTEPNLLVMCDELYCNQKRITPISIEIVCEISLQCLDILEAAHEHEIAYMDHKAWHFYWNHRRGRVYIIDWNVITYITEKADKESYIARDLMVFAQYVLTHMFLQKPLKSAFGRRPDTDLNANNDMVNQFFINNESLINKRVTQEEFDFIRQATNGDYKTVSDMREQIQALIEKRKLSI